MATVEYPLGPVERLDELFPPAGLADPSIGLKSQTDVIAHYTRQSLEADGLGGASVAVAERDGAYVVTATAEAADDTMAAFAARHRTIFGDAVAGKALAGCALLRRLGVWNPMEGFPVNANPGDGDCKWRLFLPLGLNVIGQKAILLMHYPPWATLRAASFLDSMTMSRWNRILRCSGVPEAELGRYRTIIDVNPIAAPGSGQSEYPNDYFPIMMASGFFDGGPDRDYIRSMLRLYLDGPEAKGSRYTLPLLVCGSPLYDPQAPCWFRAAFKDRLPLDANGTPAVDVLQTGAIRLFPDSARETPYMIANHMIAAGVTGRCTADRAGIPDIRKYEAQDLVAASFVRQYDANPDLDPAEAKARACRRWFGDADGAPPNPPDSADRRVLCALAQMDLFFSYAPKPHPTYSYEEACARCAGAGDDPCAPSIRPPPRTG